MNKPFINIYLLMVLLTCALVSCTTPIHISPDAVLPDGSTYKGAIKAGKFDGEGELVYPYGDFYRGDFSNGLMHGKGIYNAEGYRTYAGNFTDGSATGEFEVTEPQQSIIYVGDLVEWRFEGQGDYKSPTEHYVGQFKDNLFHGEGRISYLDQNEDEYSVYEGAFVEGVMQGIGRYVLTDDIYQGDFFNGSFEGQGTHTKADGSVLKGQFSQWKLNGEGQVLFKNGDILKTNFEYGYANGQGTHEKTNGEIYQGNFSYGQYDGEGTYTIPGKSVYSGEFSNGKYSGKGSLKTIENNVAVSVQTGVWRNGHLVGEGTNPITQGEVALENHHRILEEAKNSIARSDPDNANVYFLGVAGDGQQSVFKKELLFVRDIIQQRYSTQGRELLLVNHHSSAAQYPLASRASILESLRYIGKVMDNDNDILIIYLTSHGSAEHDLSLNHSDISLSNISSTELAKAVSESSARWKAIFISACYSGGFIKDLKDEMTLIATAADASNTSFGCSEDSEGTYFAKALMQETLAKAPELSIDIAFEKASLLIREWEAEKDVESSNPQLYSTEKILNKLKIARSKPDSKGL